MILVKGHDRPKEEEGEVEVVFQQVVERVVALFLLTVLQSKAHTTHDGEAAAAVKEDVLQVERAGHQRFLRLSFE